MEFFGVGPLELFFIVFLALILIGPKDMVKTSRTLGAWLNKFVRSDTYKVIQKTGAEIRDLPNTLMREANLEEARSEMERWKQDVNQIGGSQEIRQAISRSFDEKQLFTPPAEETPSAETPAPPLTPEDKGGAA